MGVSEVGGTSWGIPILRIMTIVFWGLYWSPPVLGKNHMSSKLSDPSCRDSGTKIHDIEKAYAKPHDAFPLHPEQ